MSFSSARPTVTESVTSPRQHELAGVGAIGDVRRPGPVGLQDGGEFAGGELIGAERHGPDYRGWANPIPEVVLAAPHGS